MERTYVSVSPFNAFSFLLLTLSLSLPRNVAQLLTAHSSYYYCSYTVHCLTFTIHLGQCSGIAKHVSQQHSACKQVYNLQFILHSNFWRVCFSALWSTSHAMKVIVLYKFCEDRAFNKYFHAFSSAFDVSVLWKRLLVRILIRRHDVTRRHRSHTPQSYIISRAQ